MYYVLIYNIYVQTILIVTTMKTSDKILKRLKKMHPKKYQNIKKKP